MINSQDDGRRGVFGLISDIADKTEVLGKAANLVAKSIELVQKLNLVASEAFSRLAKSAERTKNLFDVFAFPRALFEIAAPEINKETGRPVVDSHGRHVYLLTNAKKSFEKKAEKVCMAVSSFFKSIIGLGKYELIDLSKWKKWTLDSGGNLSVLEFVANSFMIIANFFSLSESASEIQKQNKTLKTEGDKESKWRVRPELKALLMNADDATVEALKRKFTYKERHFHIEVLSKQQHIHRLEEELRQIEQLPEAQRETSRIEIQAKRLHVQRDLDDASRKMSKYSHRLTHLNNHEYESVANQWSVDKINRKIQNHHNHYENAKDKKYIGMVKIASTISKIAVVALAMTLTALNAWTIIPTIVVLSLGIFTDFTALYRAYLEEHKIHSRVAHRVAV